MALITFLRCRISDQVMGTNNERMVSELIFKVNDDPEQFTCQLHQDAGGDHEFQNTPLILTLPDEMEGKFHYEQFRSAAEYYYRLYVPAKGGGQNIQIKSSETGDPWGQEIDDVDQLAED